MLQCTVNKHKTNWHHMLFSVQWDYRTIVKTATGFTPFHRVHGVKATLPIEWEITTLCTAIEILLDTAPMEQRLLNLELLDEDCQSSLHNNEVAKNDRRLPSITMSTFDHSMKVTLPFLTISLTIPLAMASLIHYGMDLTPSNISSLKAHTSWPLPKVTPSKNPSTGFT